MKTLSGHLSPETAYVVEDYPYGFRLRCSIRYWLEHHKTRGTRFMSQTSNPKRGGAWNKPKASTYCRFAGAMYLNDEGHVTWSGVNEYMDLAQTVDWRRTFGATLPEPQHKFLDLWIYRKQAYETAKQERRITCTTTTSINGGPATVVTERVEPEQGTSSNPVHYGMTLEGTPEEKRAKFETNLAKFSADAQAGKVVCITDMLCQAEQLHVEGR